MSIIFLGPITGAASRAFDADTLAWEAAVIANGGNVSLARRIIVDQFIFDEKASGAWTLTDDYWAFWAENAPQALTSLKQRRLAAVINSPVFTTDRDYTFDGLSNYGNLAFIPSTHGINNTGTEQRLAVYERTNLSSSGISAGTTDGTSQALSINNRSAGNISARTNAVGVTSALSLADSRGLKAVSRAGGGTTMKFLDGGVRLTDGVAIAPGSTAPTRAIYVGAINSIGTAASFRAASIGFVIIGGPLSDAQELAQYNAVQAWATSVGANV